MKKTIILSGVLILFLAFPPSGDAYSVLTHEHSQTRFGPRTSVRCCRRVSPTPPKTSCTKRMPMLTAAPSSKTWATIRTATRPSSTWRTTSASGDFIQALLRDSQDINEYAFALGAMAHWAADNDGHRLAVNRAVPCCIPS